MQFHPVILSGGNGSRLWPLSRAAMPKQTALTGQDSMVQATVQRAASIPGACAPLLICNDAHRFIIKEQLDAMDCQPAGIILVPVGRNTAAAIALAAIKLAETEPDAIMLVLHADHDH